MNIEDYSKNVTVSVVTKNGGEHSGAMPYVEAQRLAHGVRNGGFREDPGPLRTEQGDLSLHPGSIETVLIHGLKTGGD